MQMIQPLLNFDTRGFYQKASKSTVCGLSTFSLLSETMKVLGAKKGELLKYYTSAEIYHDKENAVGYASIIFY